MCAPFRHRLRYTPLGYHVVWVASRQEGGSVAQDDGDDDDAQPSEHERAVPAGADEGQGPGVGARPEEEVVLAQVVVQQGGEHQRRGERDEQAPRAQRPDDEHRLPEQPVGEGEPQGVDHLGGAHEPAREAHPAEAGDGDRHNHRFGDETEEGVREPEHAGLRRGADGAAAERGADVARQLGRRVRGEHDGVGGEDEGGEEAERRREQHRAEDPAVGVAHPAQVQPGGGRRRRGRGHPAMVPPDPDETPGTYVPADHPPGAPTESPRPTESSLPTGSSFPTERSLATGSSFPTESSLLAGSSFPTESSLLAGSSLLAERSLLSERSLSHRALTSQRALTSYRQLGPDRGGMRGTYAQTGSSRWSTRDAARPV